MSAANTTEAPPNERTQFENTNARFNMPYDYQGPGGTFEWTPLDTYWQASVGGGWQNYKANILPPIQDPNAVERFANSFYNYKSSAQYGRDPVLGGLYYTKAAPAGNGLNSEVAGPIEFSGNDIAGVGSRITGIYTISGYAQSREYDPDVKQGRRKSAHVAKLFKL